MNIHYKKFLLFLYYHGVLKDLKLVERMRILEKCRDITSDLDRKKYYEEKMEFVLWHYLTKIPSRI